MNRHPIVSAAALAAVIALAAPAVAQSAGGSSANSGSVSASLGDPDFIHAIALANNGEIDEAKYMVAHASSPVVRAFAQKLLADHRAAGKKLQALVATLMPKELLPVNEVTPATQDEYQDLVTRSGAKLDATYMSDQLLDHQNALQLLNAEAIEGQSPAVRRFATSLRPVISQHLAMVRGYIASRGKSTKPVG